MTTQDVANRFIELSKEGKYDVIQDELYSSDCESIEPANAMAAGLAHAKGMDEKKVGKDRLIKAVERAIFYGAYNYTIIKKILQGGLDQIDPADDIHPVVPLPSHNNIRGPQSYL